MTERLWIAVCVAVFWGGSVFERKWWRWHRASRSFVIEDHALAEDEVFVADVQRAVLAHCERVKPSAEDEGKPREETEPSDSQ